jgi:hypothetical protein
VHRLRPPGRDPSFAGALRLMTVEVPTLTNTGLPWCRAGRDLGSSSEIPPIFKHHPDKISKSRQRAQRAAQNGNRQIQRHKARANKRSSGSPTASEGIRTNASLIQALFTRQQREFSSHPVLYACRRDIDAKQPSMRQLDSLSAVHAARFISSIRFAPIARIPALAGWSNV